MKLTILGNNGPYPAADGACSGYLISDDAETTRVLIDCGTGVLRNLLNILQPKDLDAVVLSHLHFDHMSDMLPMVYQLQFHPRTKPLPVYAPETPEGVRALLDVPAYDVWPMADFTVGALHFSFNRVRHPVETYAVCVCGDGAKFVFTGDSNTDVSLELFCQNADLLLADAGLSEADYKFAAPHFSAALCGKLAADTGAKQLLLTHFNPKYDPDDLLAEARECCPHAQKAEIGQTCYI